MSEQEPIDHFKLVDQILATQPTEHVAVFRHGALFSEYGYAKPLLGKPFQWVWYKQRLVTETNETLIELLSLCK